ncbi:hypothetical protein HMPREF9062_0480 [Actinomyces sp. oral taxon 448 str. F0400]|nr:hypothetical protein HMPREF9062_0480 [Actinomyces sp. oral taxon 448 str. F0400]
MPGDDRHGSSLSGRRRRRAAWKRVAARRLPACGPDDGVDPQAGWRDWSVMSTLTYGGGLCRLQFCPVVQGVIMLNESKWKFIDNR